MNNILLSITGTKSFDWSNKLKEINSRKITEVAVFLSSFDKKERDNFYRLLLKSMVRTIPFVHLRDDVTKEEIKFFIDRFKTGYFNIHEDHFKKLDQWQGYWDKLYLEMNFNDEIAKDVKVKKIGGFCVDLAHLKAAISRGTEEASYVFFKKTKSEIACNHLNGYDPLKMEDVHLIKNLSAFDYLTTLPQYAFGKIIALEVYNSIEEQIKFKEYLDRLLEKYLLK
ncbi:MAG: hypothetical protein A2922_02795 [Candidatus Nealsonbacteria bacterium RIFCSPLOWO2_01_FULL_43_36]|uniref:Uncharacterized protein n=1 Tax=Candidatus Nealsonbacteria bacterium RIFCSPHIGHO2_02_FULL_43_13 TaxID=1801668 RepID=A0A1G2E9R4_9BACT|nr:MAG: hypothetical protein A3D46_00535 [Candidatus Nealsonbacteria bacterium RIFCSPHIGHO2_02_FULL_43_13]OGZ25334.1 MAG: hypothetical protein A2922_02795 [Candidatus Nealsonbacteria bacterium RIFCSPLOWO2_01_FULL_43_36]